MDNRVELINEICGTIGLKRSSPKSQYLSRRELEFMRGWIRGEQAKRKS